MASGGGPNIPRRQAQLLGLRAKGWSIDQMVALTGLGRRTVIVTLSKAKRADREAAERAGMEAGRAAKEEARRPSAPVVIAAPAAGSFIPAAAPA